MCSLSITVKVISGITFDLMLVLRIALACPTDKREHSGHYQAKIVRAPEVSLGPGYLWSAAIDIWSIGCLVSSTDGLMRNSF
jgi:hypothetical protein